MFGVEIKQQLIFVAGNPAGYIQKKSAVLDVIFQSKELKQYLEQQELEVEWKDNVFEQLLSNRRYYERESGEERKQVRIWQLKDDVEFGMRFTSYDEMLKKYGSPELENYEVVFDAMLNTNNLEKIYELCNKQHPDGYRGHSMSISDIVELYDDKASQFYFVDRFGFKEMELMNDETIMDMQQM